MIKIIPQIFRETFSAVTTDELFMRRALELAKLGIGNVSPNPMVGCVIIYNDMIIGEGWHKLHGGPHAEVNAVESVVDKSLLKEATVYVNLEPCAHHGKTPPCADMLVQLNIKKVVISNVDTNELVAGKGIRKLQNAGIEVVTGVLQEEGRELNKRFFTFFEKKRPYIILKWAETADGFIARENHESKWISNGYSRQLVHRWRAEEDAVLVGTGTAQYDNPSLNVREWSGRNPVRLVSDHFLRLSDKLNLFDRSQPTIRYNILKGEEHQNLLLVKLNEGDFWQEMIQDLYQRKLQSVIIEGGAKTLELFINNGLWDEARIFKSSHSFGSGISAPRLRGTLVSEQKIMNDNLSVFYNE